LIRTMETELRTLTTYIAAHSESLHCKNSEQLREALWRIQNGTALGFDWGDDFAHDTLIPALSYGKSASSISNGQSLATSSPSTTQTSILDPFGFGDMIDSPLYTGVFED
jgi:hypothetical protein